MKTHKISSFVAALAASIAIPAAAATLEQALSFELSGNAAGAPYTFHTVQVTPDVGIRIATKDIIALLADASTSNLRNAQLLILSQFGPVTVVTNTGPDIETNIVSTVVTNGAHTTTNFTVTVITNLAVVDTTIVTNREATQVVIRGIKGRTNDLDVTSFFHFETLTNAPVTKTGRTDASTGADLGENRFELARIAIQDGTNAPLLSVRGYKIVTLTPRTVTINHKPVSGILRSWDFNSANGVGRSELGAVSVFGGASATVLGVTD